MWRELDVLRRSRQRSKLGMSCYPVWGSLGKEKGYWSFFSEGLRFGQKDWGLSEVKSFLISYQFFFFFMNYDNTIIDGKQRPTLHGPRYGFRNFCSDVKWQTSRDDPSGRIVDEKRQSLHLRVFIILWTSSPVSTLNLVLPRQKFRLTDSRL